MNNPFELESCILHHHIKHDPRRNNTQTSSDWPSFPIVADSLPAPKIFESLYLSDPDSKPPASTNTKWQGNTNTNNHSAQTIPAPVPTITECAVHLELLEAFLVLKRRVLKSNALDITFNTCRDRSTQLRTDAGWLKTREEKWEKFLDLAVLRFEVWWDHMAPKIINRKDGFDSFPLPPLDVLMVWHTYMLNPGFYREDLNKKSGLGMEGVEELQLRGCAKFPWRAIHQAINHYSRAYTIDKGDRKEWEKITAMPEDLFEFLSDYEKMHGETRAILGRCALETPEGGERWLTPRYFAQMVMRTSERELIQIYIKKDSWCLWQINRDFGWNGCSNRSYERSWHGVSNSFYLSNSECTKFISSIFSAAFIDSDGFLCPPQTLFEFRQKVLDVSNNPTFVIEFSKDTTDQYHPQGAVSRTIDWLFENYTRHGYICGPSLDLKAAVQRQESFIRKMGNLLLIRSPYLEGTLSRALIRYNRFFELVRLRHKSPVTKSMRGNHDQNANIDSLNNRPLVVPTLDIDIVWHTHQLDPAGYYAYCTEKVGEFINHNDDLHSEDLQKGWEMTKEIYWRKFGDVYGLCLCWMCEGVKNKAAELMNGGLVMAGKKMDWAKVGREVRDEVEFWTKREMKRRLEP